MKSFVLLLFFAVAMFRTVHGLCSSLPSSACAVLYTDESCQGRSFAVADNALYFGDSDNTLEDVELRAWLRQNDVESLSVAAGCALVGHEAENLRGRGISISADDSSDHHIADLERYEHILDEDIKSVECRCGEGQATREVKAGRWVGGQGQQTKCPEVPQDVCAVIYSEESCGGTSTHFTDEPGVDQQREWLSRNDAESVSVAAGCTLVGYENENGRGRGMSISADDSADHHIVDLEHYEHILDEDIKSVECRCGEGQATREVKAVEDRPTSVGGQGQQTQCPPVPKDVCAIIYSEESCGGTSTHFTDEPGVAQKREWLSRNDAESVSVAAGCTLVGYENENGRGRGISIRADDSADHHIVDLEHYEHILDEDIKSVECRCGEGQATREVKAVEDRPTSVGGQGQQTQCPPVPKDVCAVIYSEESCGGTSTHFTNVPGVDQKREWLSRNDAESVSVAAGCTLVGYENENGRGRGISISADDSADHHIVDLEHYEHILDEDIKSVECRCGEGQATREVSAVVENGPASVGGQGQQGSQTQCPPVPKDVCAVIYSEESCGGMSSYFTNEPGFDQMRSMRKWLRRNDAESVSVAAGCTLVGYEERRLYENGRGRGISISADIYADHHVEDLDSYEHILDEDIKSVDCRCGEGSSTREVFAIVGGPVEVGGQGPHCPPVPKGVCAVIYSQESCGGTSSHFTANVDQNEQNWLRLNDAESVSVAAGCTLVGYENENGRGRGISVSANNNADHHVADLDLYHHILDEDIRSVECTCGEGTSTREVSAVVEDGPEGGQGGQATHAECRLVPKGVCAVLYSDDSCNGRTLNVFNDSSLVAATRGWLSQNDVESLSVGAGCTLVGHEAENGRGRGISISADISADHHVTDLEAYEHLYDEDMRSVECTCHEGSRRDVSAVGELSRARVADCPAVPEGTCAVVYSEEGCQGQRRVVAVGSGGVGEEPESVSVAAGCTLTGYEAEHSVAVEGGTRGKHVEDLEMFLKLHGAVRDLESFQCECN